MPDEPQPFTDDEIRALSQTAFVDMRWGKTHIARAFATIHALKDRLAKAEEERDNAQAFYEGQSDRADDLQNALLKVQQERDDLKARLETAKQKTCVHVNVAGDCSVKAELRDSDRRVDSMQQDYEREYERANSLEAKLEERNQDLLSHAQNEHPHEYKELVEVLAREETLKAKLAEAEMAGTGRLYFNALLKFRRDLRQMLSAHGAASNPGWTERDIGNSLEMLVTGAEAREVALREALEFYENGERKVRVEVSRVMDGASVYAGPIFVADDGQVARRALADDSSPRAAQIKAILEVIERPEFRGLWRSREIAEDGSVTDGWSVTFVRDGDCVELPYRATPAEATQLAIRAMEGAK